mgnify:CR=1 FL=1
MIDKEKFGKFQKVLTSGSVDMQGVKAREWTGLSGDDHNEILANYTSYSEEFLNADTKLEPEPVAEPAPDLDEEEPEAEEPEDNGPSDSEIDEAEIEKQVSNFHDESEED